jgi:hypothetical protein
VAQSQQEQAYLNFRGAIPMQAGRFPMRFTGMMRPGEEIAEKSQEFEAYDLATSYSEELLNNGLASYLEALTARQCALNS